MASASLVVRLSVPVLLLAGLIGCSSGNNPVHNAAILGGPEELDAAMRQPGAMINGQNRTHNTPLHEAVLHDNEPAVRWLITHGASVKIGDEDGDTPLHFAATKGFADVVEDLVNIGKADVNGRNLNGQTPLHMAAANASTDICKLLIAHGANVNVKDTDGDTPLHLAAAGAGSGEDSSSTVSLMEVSAETVEFLLSKGADPNIRNMAGMTPRMKALENGNHAAAIALSRRGTK